MFGEEVTLNSGRNQTDTHTRHNNIPSLTPQVVSGEGSVYTDTHMERKNLKG